jgi:hypothetical protein
LGNHCVSSICLARLVGTNSKQYRFDGLMFEGMPSWHFR